MIVFLQVRGSVPLLWTQPSNWKLRPLVSVLPTVPLSRQAQALKTHLLDLACAYFSEASAWCIGQGGTMTEASAVHVVNLIDRRGTQGELGRLLMKVWQRLQRGTIQACNRFATLKATATGPTHPADGDMDAVAEVENVEEIAAMHVTDQLDRAVVDTQIAELKVTPQDTRVMYDVTTGQEGEEAEQPALSVSVKHHWFDYHHKCKTNGQEALKELFPALRSALSETEGIFVAERVGGKNSASVGNDVRHSNMRDKMRVRSVQRHLIRTNCMDCLDRTNVAQSVFARWALRRQFAALAAMAPVKVVKGGDRHRNDDQSRSNVEEDGSLALPERVSAIVFASVGHAAAVLALCSLRSFHVPEGGGDAVPPGVDGERGPPQPHVRWIQVGNDRLCGWYRRLY